MDIAREEKIIQNVKFFINTLPKEVYLIAVTKSVGIEEIRIAVKAGIKHIGENRVQEALSKYPYLSDLNIKWHLIGHLQSNKVKKAVKIFDYIHSVDSKQLASKINEEALKINKVQDILIQVNISGETTKFGIDKGDIFSLLEDISNLENIRVKGLMTIAPYTYNKDIISKVFKELKELKEKLSIDYKELEFLSMGMSNDYEIALQQGANMLRIGSKIFKN